MFKDNFRPKTRHSALVHTWERQGQKCFFGGVGGGSGLKREQFLKKIIPFFFHLSETKCKVITSKTGFNCLPKFV